MLVGQEVIYGKLQVVCQQVFGGTMKIF